jgi:hypothetical protein
MTSKPPSGDKPKKQRSVAKLQGKVIVLGCSSDINDVTNMAAKLYIYMDIIIYIKCKHFMGDLRHFQGQLLL